MFALESVLYKQNEGVTWNTCCDMQTICDNKMLCSLMYWVYIYIVVGIEICLLKLNSNLTCHAKHKSNTNPSFTRNICCLDQKRVYSNLLCGRHYMTKADLARFQTSHFWISVIMESHINANRTALKIDAALLYSFRSIGIILSSKPITSVVLCILSWVGPYVSWFDIFRNFTPAHVPLPSRAIVGFCLDMWVRKRLLLGDKW